MNKGLSNIIFPSADLAKSKKLFTALFGVEPVADSEYYLGYQLGEVHIGFNPNPEQHGLTGPTPHFLVGDINAAIESLTAAGATLVSGPTPIPDSQVAVLKDADGNTVGLLEG